MSYYPIVCKYSKSALSNPSLISLLLRNKQLSSSDLLSLRFYHLQGVLQMISNNNEILNWEHGSIFCLSWGESYCLSQVAMKAEKSLGVLYSVPWAWINLLMSKGGFLWMSPLECSEIYDFHLINNLWWASSIFKYMSHITPAMIIISRSELSDVLLWLRQFMKISHSKVVSV